MQRKLLLFQLVAMLFLFMNSSAQDLRPGASISPGEARAFATQQLPNVLQWIEVEDLALYGFSATDDFSKIIVGRPFYLSSMDAVNQMHQERRSSLQIKSMMLPLILEQSVRCFIYVSFEEGKWKAVGIGSRQYAVKGGSLFNKSDDNATLIVSIPHMNEEFIADNSKGNIQYKPIFHSNAELVKESYTIDELKILFTEFLKKIK